MFFVQLGTTNLWLSWHGMMAFVVFSINPFAPEPPVTAHADPRPFYPL